MYDLIVIGGGPAGSAAAITAARSGTKVLLLERGRLPRHKVCGEFVSAESLALLESLLRPQDQGLLDRAVRITRARVFMDDHQFSTAIDPAAASITRFDLDAALWRSAEACGVETRQRVAVHGISGDGPFLLSSSAGDLQTRAVVNASGRWSNLTQAAPANGPKWLGLKAHFPETEPDPSVDLYFFDGGYCGVQPLNQESVNACAMVRSDRASSLQEVLELHPALRERSRSWRAWMEPVSTSPLIFRKPEPAKDGVLMAGDAAAFVDPFVGDGISLGLRSGRLAAECLLPFFRGDVDFPRAATDYCGEYERRFAGIFQTSSKLRRMLTLPRPVRKPLLLLLQNAPRIARAMVSRTR